MADRVKYAPNASQSGFQGDQTIAESSTMGTIFTVEQGRSICRLRQRCGFQGRTANEESFCMVFIRTLARSNPGSYPHEADYRKSCDEVAILDFITGFDDLASQYEAESNFDTKDDEGSQAMVPTASVARLIRLGKIPQHHFVCNKGCLTAQSSPSVGSTIAMEGHDVFQQAQS